MDNFKLNLQNSLRRFVFFESRRRSTDFLRRVDHERERRDRVRVVRAVRDPVMRQACLRACTAHDQRAE